MNWSPGRSHRCIHQCVFNNDLMRVSTGETWDPGAQYHGAGILEKIVKTIGQIHLDTETLVLTAHEMSPIG